MAAHVYYLHIIVTAECFSNILDLPAFMMCSEQLGIIIYLSDLVRQDGLSLEDQSFF